MVKVKCLKCRKENEDNAIFCYNCGKIIIKCSNCECVISENDEFCGNCGSNTSDDILKAKQKEKEKNEKDKEIEIKKLQTILQKQVEQDMKVSSFDILIDSEGNQFKAIKDFKNKYNVSTEVATEYINNALKEFNKKNNINTNEPKYENQSNTISESKNEYVDPKGIKKTIIVASSSRKKATSAIGRGLIGGALLGPVGLLAGASAKSKETTTFQVIYNNGKQETVTVKTGGWMFNQYCKYLEK